MYILNNFLKISVLSLSLLYSKISESQCLVQVESSTGYTVAIEITVTGIIAGTHCPWGYNFNLELDYDISFSGPGAPGSLYTLQGNIGCDAFPSNFYNLPNSGGTGSTTTGSNPYNSNTDCATATPESLGCDAVSIQIHGPGIPDQVVDCFFGSPLPISLLSFHAKATDNNEVYLNWITASELNNAYFNIEHSVDGINWTTVDEQKGAGTSTEFTTYDFTHTKAVLGTNYYRLKQTDFDGKFEYSYIRSVEITNIVPENKILIYPNPGNEMVTIQANPSELEFVEIYDVCSNRVKFFEPLSNDNDKMILNIGDLAPGIYFVKTKNHLEKLIVK